MQHVQNMLFRSEHSIELGGDHSAEITRKNEAYSAVQTEPGANAPLERAGGASLLCSNVGSPAQKEVCVHTEEWTAAWVSHVAALFDKWFVQESPVFERDQRVSDAVGAPTTMEQLTLGQISALLKVSRNSLVLWGSTAQTTCDETISS
jgi:hypothetical protein